MKPVNKSGHDSERRVQLIQKTLNQLCSQHDSYMPLLDFPSFASSLQRWETSLKKINKKISEYEILINSTSKANETLEVRRFAIKDDQRHSQLSKTMEEAKFKIDELKNIVSINNLSKKNINHTDSKGSNLLRVKPFPFHSITPEGSAHQSPINHKEATNSSFSHAPSRTTLAAFKEQLEEIGKQKLDELAKYLSLTLALFANEIHITELAHSRRSSPKNNEGLTEGACEYLQASHTNLIYQEIHAIKAGLPKINLCDFHSRTRQRLKVELIEINEQIESIFQNKNTSTFQISSQIETLHRCLQLIHWQLAGLKKKYNRELELQYQREADHYKVNNIQEKMVRDLRELEEGHKVLVDKIDHLRNRFGQSDRS